MSINLSKGQKIDLTKGNSGLKKLLIGLGWDTNKYDGGHEFDLDACAALRTNGECTSDKRFVYFGNLKSENDSVIHTGDNLTGKGDGDDEQIKVDLTLLDEDIDEISFNIVIYQAENRQQNFGQISNAFVRVVNEETNEKNQISCRSTQRFIVKKTARN